MAQQWKPMVAGRGSFNLQPASPEQVAPPSFRAGFALRRGCGGCGGCGGPSAAAMLAPLGPAWGHVRGYVGHVGPSCGFVGTSWGHVGPSWGSVGPILGLCGPSLRPKLGHLKAVFWASLRPFWGFCWAMLTHVDTQDRKNGCSNSGLGVAEQHIAAAHQDVDAAQLADAQRQDVGKHLLGHLQGVAGHKWAGHL